MKTMHKFQIEGELLEVGPVQTFGQRGFTKRRLIIETSNQPDQWSNPTAVTLTKDRVAVGDKLRVGQTVHVEGYVDGRRWDGPKGAQFFIDLIVGSIEVQGEAPATPTDAQQADDPDALPDNMPF